MAKELNQKPSRSLKLRVRGFVNELLRGRLVAAYRSLGLRATDEVWGSRITYEPATDIGGALYYTGEFERSELELCRRYVSRDSTVLDIGANIGLHSIYFSNLATEGCVLALEPDLDTFDLLRRNVSRRRNVVPLNLAISDKGGVVEFFHASDSAYSSLKDTKRTAIAKTVRVPCMTLDDVVAALRLKRVDFVKIDVEGFEFNVLEGMTKIISNFHPVIFCEIYKGTGSNQVPDETVKFLLDKDYSAFVLRDGEMVQYERHDDNLYNYLFLPGSSGHP
jgi:FkbM family methyltransferase